MKPAGFPLLALALAGGAWAQEPVRAKPAKTSSRLTHEIQAALPKYETLPRPVLDRPKDLPNDPDVLTLPKVTVREYRPPAHDPDVWLTNKTVQQKAMAAYKQSLTDLEWALNGWYIPLFGSSPAARARAAYEANKKMGELHRVHRLFQLIATQHPTDGAELERERIKMHQAEHWQRRPAGDGRKK